MAVKSEKIIISALMNIFHSKGYVTFDDILEHCAIYELTFINAEIICNNLMDKGVRIEWYGSEEKSEPPIIDEIKETEISVCSSTEKPEQVVINTLYTKFQSQGYITEDDIFEMCDEYELSFVKTDYVSGQLLAKGVLISDEIKVASDSVESNHESLYDHSKINYNEIYDFFLYNYPELKSIIEFSKSVPPVQKGEIKQLIAQMKSGNKFARELIINKHIRVALRIALQYKDKTSIPLCDIFSEAMLGVVKAVDSFDPYENSHFSSYASLWVKQHVDRYINDFERVIRIPVHQSEKISKAITIETLNPGLDNEELIVLIAKELDVSNEEAEMIFSYMKPEELDSIEELLDSDVDIYTYDSIYLEDSVDEVAIKSLLKGNVELVMNTLADREKYVIALRYGLKNDDDGMTLEEVGQKMNITRERVRQIEAKGLRKLRHHSCSKYLKDFITYFYEKDEKDYVVEDESLRAFKKKKSKEKINDSQINNKKTDMSEKRENECSPECTIYFW